MNLIVKDPQLTWLHLASLYVNVSYKYGRSDTYSSYRDHGGLAFLVQKYPLKPQSQLQLGSIG